MSDSLHFKPDEILSTRNKVIRWAANDWRVLTCIGKDSLGNFRFSTLSKHSNKRSALLALRKPSKP